MIWRCDFLHFRISEENGQICGFHWTFKSKKCFSFRGALPPLTPRPGALPLNPTGGSGALPLDPTGGSTPRPPLQARTLRARHAPPLPNPKYVIACIHPSHVGSTQLAYPTGMQAWIDLNWSNFYGASLHYFVITCSLIRTMELLHVWYSVAQGNILAWPL